MGRRRRRKNRETGAHVAPVSFGQTPTTHPPVSPKEVTKYQADVFVGPIPPPSVLQEYENIRPGFADRIVTQFEEQGRHRRGIEKKIVNHNILSATVGQITGFLVFLAAIGGGAFLLYLDKPVGGLATIISAVGSAAWVLRKAERAKQNDLAEKRQSASETVVRGR